MAALDLHVDPPQALEVGDFADMAPGEVDKLQNVLARGIDVAIILFLQGYTASHWTSCHATFVHVM